GMQGGTEMAGIATDCFFASIQNLRGGTGNDAFKFCGPGALTGGIDGRGGVGNLIVGNDNDDNFLINGTNAGTISGLLGTKGFVNIGSLKGGLANDTFTFFAGGKLTGTIDGGGAGPNGNTIVGNDLGDTFTITTANAGNLANTGGANLLGAGGFTNIQNLAGGLLDDTFTFGLNGSLTGKIDGGGQGPGGNTIVGDPGALGDQFTITGVNA